MKHEVKVTRLFCPVREVPNEQRGRRTHDGIQGASASSYTRPKSEEMSSLRKDVQRRHISRFSLLVRSSRYVTHSIHFCICELSQRHFYSSRDEANLSEVPQYHYVLIHERSQESLQQAWFEDSRVATELWLQLL